MATTMKYTVLAGDSYYGIATGINAAAGVTYQAIQQANGGISPSALAIGQILNIPAGNGSGTALHYTVMSGDTLSNIADGINASTGVTYQQIEQANPNIPASALAPGQILSIPSPGGSQEKVDAENIGYWNKTWAPSGAPPGATLGLAFSGYADPEQALQESQKVYASLVGNKYLSLGGSSTAADGSKPGRFTHALLQSIVAYINAGRFVDYFGVAFDVEEGDGGLAGDFQQAFAACQAKNLKVLVTVSHSAPFDIPDAAQLMDGFFADANIDFLSPQLYSNGSETENDYATTWGVSTTWAQYATAKASIIPSVVTASLYPSAQQFFQEQGVQTKGYVQWTAAS